MSLRELRRRLAPWLLPLGATALVWLGLAWLHGGAVGRPGDVAPLGPASFEVLEGPPASREVALPHDWSETDPEALRGRYRFEAVLGEVPAGGLALYLPSANTGGRVFVNGTPVEDGAGYHGMSSHEWHVPLYVSVPGALLRAGTNSLDLEIEPDGPGLGYLAPPYLGPAASLRPSYELRHFLQVSGIQILVIVSVGFGALLALLYALRRKQPEYVWFACVCWVFAFGFTNLVAIEMWLPKPSHRWVGAVTMAWLSVAIAIFVHRFLGEVHRRLELALLGAALLGSLYFALTLGTPWFRAALPFWAGAVLVAGLYPGVKVVRAFVRSPTRELQLVVASGLVIATAGVHDVLLVNGPISLEHDFAIVWAAVVSLAIFAFLFVKRFIVALDTSEALTAELERRVADKAAALEASHASLRRLEAERAIQRERERLMAEIHDGMGGQLVSTLAMIRGGDAEPVLVEAALREALDDMRLVVHSLGQDASDVPTLLGTLRARLGGRLEGAGIRLHWAVDDVPPLPDFGPEKALHLMRILQEAITNVVRHAGATELAVATEVCDGAVVVSLSDDGGGLRERADAGAGRGLANMRRRAEQIGAELTVASGAVGTEVRIRLPLAGVPAGASAR